jgi:predicted N-acetyltransferase YhbS
MKIRKIQENDLPICSTLLERAYGFSPYNEIFKEYTAQEYIARKYKNCKENSFVLIDENGNVVAFAFFNVSSWSEGLQATLEEVVVDSKRQSKGIGREIVTDI